MCLTSPHTLTESLELLLSGSTDSIRKSDWSAFNVTDKRFIQPTSLFLRVGHPFPNIFWKVFTTLICKINPSNGGDLLSDVPGDSCIMPLPLSVKKEKMASEGSCSKSHNAATVCLSKTSELKEVICHCWSVGNTVHFYITV